MTRTRYTRLPLSLAAATLVAVTLIGCDIGSEGQRCNPARTASGSSDECNDGLQCTLPPGCAINICCPTSGPATDPNCGPNPPCALDAGSDSATEDGSAQDASADAPEDEQADAPADAAGQ